MVKTKTKQKFTCPDCDKELKNAKALAGHLWFAHGRRAGEKASLYDNIKTLEREKGTNPDTIERIENIENIVGELVESETKLVAMIKDLTGSVKRIIELIPKPANPGNPGKTEKKDPDQVKKKTDKKKDGFLGLSNLGRWLFGSDDDKNDEKESEKTDDDNSWFL
ncbi:hypothetical protein ES705_44506 [subsurface metagenome]